MSLQMIELQEKENIYQNNIAILSMCRLDEDSGRTTVQFNPPSLALNARNTTSFESRIDSRSSLDSGKKWYKIGFYNFVISALVVICFCVVLGVVITTVKSTRHPQNGFASPLQTDHDYNRDPITLNDVLVGTLTPNLFNGSWISDEKIAYYDWDNNLCTFDINSKQKAILIKNDSVLFHGLNGDLLSNNLDHLLSPYDISKTFRHSTISKYKIYNIINDSKSDLLPDGMHFGNGLIQYAEWGPKDTQIIFVFKNNIYYKPSVDAFPIQLTATGVPNVVYNGYTDWVYEEEILDEEKAFWVSPDGADIVFATINDTKVDTATWPFYGEFTNSNQYPTEVALKYPKPGRNNPMVDIFVANLNDSVDNIEIVRLIPPEAILKHQHYFIAIGWLDNNRFTITWMTRGQNLSVIEICDKNLQWICNTSFTVESANSWVDLYSRPVPAIKHDSYFLRLPELISYEAGYYHHVAMVDIKTKNVKYLTMGLYDVIEVLTFNADEDVVYFLSTLPEKPEFRHLMSVSVNDTQNLDPICLTCYLGDSCLYNNVFFNPKADYYVLQCEGPKTPKVEIRRTKNNSMITELESNESLNERLGNKLVPKTKKLRVKTGDNFYSIVELTLPPDFDDNLKYPLMIEVYGGPGSQLVIDKYRINHWGTHLASNLSVIYARIDGRGTNNRGSKYLHEIYKNMGNVEVWDVITTARYLRDNLTYVDKNSIGIWGWSYGGYITLMSLALDHLDPVFQCGIAVAPVTNWMFYDSVYVERYMGWPDDNTNAYNQSDVLNKVEFLKDKRLLLAFGTADDNVHSQHSMVLMSKLNEMGMIYETQVYPDNDHSLRGSTIHLYQRMTDFTERCFNL